MKMAPDRKNSGGSNAQSPINFNMLEDPTNSLIFPQPFALPYAPNGWAQSPVWPMSGQQSPGMGFPNFNPMAAMSNFMLAQEYQEGYNEGYDSYEDNDTSTSTPNPPAFAQNGVIERLASTNPSRPAASTHSTALAGGEAKEASTSGQENNQDRAARLRAQLIAQRNARGQTRTPDSKSGLAERLPNLSSERPRSALGKTDAGATKESSETATIPSRITTNLKGRVDAKSTPSDHKAQTLPRTSVEIDALIAEARDGPDNTINTMRKPATPVGQSVIGRIRKEEATRKEEERQEISSREAQIQKSTSKGTPSTEAKKTAKDPAQKPFQGKPDSASKTTHVNGSMTNKTAVRGATPMLSEAGAASLEDGEIEDDPPLQEASHKAHEDPKLPKSAQKPQKKADLQVRAGEDAAAKPNGSEARKTVSLPLF